MIEKLALFQLPPGGDPASFVTAQSTVTTINAAVAKLNEVIEAVNALTESHARAEFARDHAQDWDAPGNPGHVSRMVDTSQWSPERWKLESALQQERLARQENPGASG